MAREGRKKEIKGGGKKERGGRKGKGKIEIAAVKARYSSVLS